MLRIDFLQQWFKSDLAVEGIVSEIFQRQRREIELEGQLRAEVRRARNAAWIGNTLSNQNSTLENAATR
jgi:hypothetical protein